MARTWRVRITHSEPNTEHTSGAIQGRRLWLALVLPVLYGLALSPIAALNVLRANGRATFDQVLFHEHTIDAMVPTWPVFHLTYPEHYVAMTPGFHWVLAGVARVTGMGDPGLRLVALVMSVAIFGVLGILLSKRCGAVLGSVLMAPFMASVYVANSSAWMLADNAGWMWVYLLALAALLCRPTATWAVVVGLGLLLAVWTRQNLLFLAAPLWVAAWLREAPVGPACSNPLIGIPTRAKNLVPLALTSLPAIASIVYLYRVWGGFVPYEFQGQYNGANPSNVALQLVMLGGLSIFFIPAMLGIGEESWRERCKGMLRRVAPWMAIFGVLAGLIAAIVPTTPAPKAGRAGLVWDAADTLNVLGPIGDCNPLIVVVAAAGGALLVVILACAPARQRWILGALFGGFGLAQGASSEVWQRYHEPFALVFLALATTVAVGARKPALRRRPMAQIAPIAVLALGMAVTSAVVLWQREIAPWRRGENQTPVNPQLPAPPADVPESAIAPQSE